MLQFSNLPPPNQENLKPNIDIIVNTSLSHTSVRTRKILVVSAALNFRPVPLFFL